MRAHEWTRARQRPVRQIGPAGGRLAEEDVEVAPEPLVRLEPDAEAEPTGLEAPPEATEAAEAPEAEADVTAEPVATLAEPASAAGRTPAPLLAESPAPVGEEALEVESRPPRRALPRAWRATAPRQGQLPLQLEPVTGDGVLRRSATETREDLIQRLLDPHLSLQETAKLLNVCPTTVRRYTNRGLLAHYRTPGNQRRFRLSDVLAFMERQGIPAHGLERKRTPMGSADDGVQEPS
jgi:excisionase family DNA binding protein